MSDPIQQAAALLKRAKSAAVMTGAGVSKESGVPTFRDSQSGLWAKYDPQQLATPQAYQANPKLVWDWYEYRRTMVAKAQPNPGHEALAALERHFDPFPIITQNVDNLHERAGSRYVIHLHGNINRHKCFYACQGQPTRVDIQQLSYDKHDGPPACPHCGRLSVRPDVVWFGEMLPEQELAEAFGIAQTTDVMLVIGTSGLVEPAASVPVQAKNAGASLIEINPDYSMLSSYADVKLSGPSGEMLPRLLEALDRV